MKPDSVGFEQIKWISIALLLALLPHVTDLPGWVLLIVGGTLGTRLYLSARGLAPPPGVVRTLLAVFAMGLLFITYRTFNGLRAGSALLCLVAGFKVLESRQQRDLAVITLIIFFLSLAALLANESFWLLAYLIAVCGFACATLLRSTTSFSPRWPKTLRYVRRVFLQALPLALCLWLLFPRFAGPLWQMTAEDRHAVTGLNDKMSPGDISELAQSDEVAFRVHFIAGTPDAAQRYWRGPVLSEFDGHTWSVSTLPHKALAFLPRGTPYQYRITVEPHPHNWVYTLDWPARWDLPEAFLTDDYVLMQAEPVSNPLNVLATSYPSVPPNSLVSDMRQRNLRLPPNQNPRTALLAQRLRKSAGNDLSYVRAVLAQFSREEFFYTLNPPKLTRNSIDEFLFVTKRGFCGHYASAFAVLMRAAGIPARVVTGYQGGVYNRFADYWIVKQSDAHAWDEIWLAGSGWQRIDPTSAIAPERIEHVLADRLTESTFVSRWNNPLSWLADTRLRFDALKQFWRNQILNFNQQSQNKLLEFLLIREPDTQKLVWLLTAGMALSLGWLTWAIGSELQVRRAPLIRAYQQLCTKFAVIGIARWPHQGAEDYARRIADLRPDLAVQATALCRDYNRLRYGPQGSNGTSVARFIKTVQALKIR